MELRHRPALARSTAWLVVARIGTQAALAVFSIVVARRLGAAGFGEYAFVASILFVANVLTSFGTDMLLVREIAAHRGTALAAPALALQLALAVAIGASIALLAPLVPAQSPTAVAALRLGALTLLPLAPYTVLSAMLRGGARMRAYAALNLSIAAVQVAAAARFVREGGTVLDVAAVLVATQCFGAVAAVGACRLSGIALGPLARDPRPLLRTLVARSSPIAILGALGMLYQRTPVLVVSTLAGPAATGVFSAALRGVEAAKTVHVAAWSALYPAFAEDGARDRAARHAAPRSLVALVLLALAAAAVLTVVARPLIAVVFGAAFLPAAAALRILAWALVPYTVSSHRSLELLAKGREGDILRALTLAIVALLVLGSIAVRSSGTLGACWAVLAAECVQAVALAPPWRLTRPAARTRQVGYIR